MKKGEMAKCDCTMLQALGFGSCVGSKHAYH